MAGPVDGEQPEPPARPSSGSVDGLVGAHLMRSVPMWAMGGGRVPVPLFLSVAWRHNGRGTEAYRTGDELQANVGGSYPVTERVAIPAQVNLRVRGRDDVGRTDALRDNTGGTRLYLSPGVRLQVSPGVDLTALVQLPVYQRVNRIQLVSPYHLVFGTAYAFGH